MSTAVATASLESTLAEKQVLYGLNNLGSSSTQKINEPQIDTNLAVIKKKNIRPQSSLLKPIGNSNLIREDIKQKWSGVVINSTDQEVRVRLEDLTNPLNPDEELTLSIDEIDDKDKPLIRIGALFYWYIGYRQGFKYRKERISIIRFRRLPQWTTQEIKAAEKKSQEYANFFLTD